MDGRTDGQTDGKHDGHRVMTLELNILLNSTFNKVI